MASKSEKIPAAHYVTVLGKETEFNGTLKFRDDLKILGTFHGAIDAQGNLAVDKGAVCTVDHINASSIVVNGTIHGNLYAADRVEMCSGSDVHGNIRTARIRIADGVSFSGSVSMIRTDADFDIFTSRGTGIKDKIRLPVENRQDQQK